MYLSEIHNFHLVEERFQLRSKCPSKSQPCTVLTMSRKTIPNSKNEFVVINQKLELSYSVLVLVIRSRTRFHFWWEYEDEFFVPQALNCHTPQLVPKFVGKQYEMPLRWFAWGKEPSQENFRCQKIFKLQRWLPWLVSSLNKKTHAYILGFDSNTFRISWYVNCDAVSLKLCTWEIRKIQALNLEEIEGSYL